MKSSLLVGMAEMAQFHSLLASPDITPLDFFLWGYIKDRVNAENVNNVTELNHRIEETLASITQEVLLNV